MIKNLLNKTLNILFPKNIKCIFCGEEVNENQFSLCDKCEKDFDKNYKICERCGTVVKSESNYCLVCLNNQREFNYARAPFIYKDKVVSAIHNFKYSGAKYLAEPFAKLMINSFLELKELIGNFDFIIPVPMHKNKLKKRKYNQSKLLADEISKLVSITVLDNVIVKVKNTDSQTTLSRKDRFKNMEDVFKITDKKIVKNKNILIVDDVLTSGATTESMSKLLKRNKANKVAVLTFARTEVENLN